MVTNVGPQNGLKSFFNLEPFTAFTYLPCLLSPKGKETVFGFSQKIFPPVTKVVTHTKKAKYAPKKIKVLFTF